MAAVIVKSFFESEVVKNDLKAEFEAAERRPLTTQESTAAKRDEAEESAARRAAEKARRRRDAERRLRPTNWDDGRGRR